jgi:hypothetical protein
MISADTIATLKQRGTDSILGVARALGAMRHGLKSGARARLLYGPASQTWRGPVAMGKQPAKPPSL